MLAGEELLGAAAALVGPDDLVEEGVLPEHLVAEQPPIRAGAPVQVKGQHTGRLQQVMGVLNQPPQQRQIGFPALILVGEGRVFRCRPARFPARLPKPAAPGEAVPRHEGRVDIHALRLPRIRSERAGQRSAAIAAQQQILPLPDDLPGNLNRFKHGYPS